MKASRRHGYARRIYRQDLVAFIDKNKRMLLALLIGYAALMTVMTFLASGYILGFMHALLTTSAVGLVLLAHLAVSGTMNQLSGAWGEDNTKDILGWAKRRRLIYGWIDNLEVQGGDVDHLIATSSGWIAIDSKWHSRTLDADLVANDAARAASAARRASLVLLSLRHPTSVRPVIVYWGGTRDDIPDRHRMAHAVEFVSGSYLKRWLSDLPTGSFGRRDARVILRELHIFKAEVRPPDRSLMSKPS